MQTGENMMSTQSTQQYLILDLLQFLLFFVDVIEFYGYYHC